MSTNEPVLADDIVGVITIPEALEGLNRSWTDILAIRSCEEERTLVTGQIFLYIYLYDVKDVQD